MSCCRFLILVFLVGLLSSPSYPEETAPPTGESVADTASPDEPIETITVKIRLAEDSDPLEGIIGLDLGLGFPLWLRPANHDEAVVRWGVYPTAPADSVEAGQVATFTFAAKGSAISTNEVVDSTENEEQNGTVEAASVEQLLGDLRFADIGRIAFVSTEKSATWTLKEYEVEVNGKPFAANSTVSIGPFSASDQARQQLAQLTLANGERSQAIETLRDLVAADFATDDEKSQLKQLESENAGYEREALGLRKVLEGELFFVDSFESTWRVSDGERRIQVMLLTADGKHSGTDNYVYLQLGGRKLRIASPENPLDPSEGLQTFDLDLDDSPLSLGDLRGIGLGVIAHRNPQTLDKAKWKPSRLIVKFGPRHVYDSSDIELDQRSLAATALAPSRFVNSDGNDELFPLTSNVVAVWRSGHGQGLDSSTDPQTSLALSSDPTGPGPLPDSTTQPASDDWQSQGDGIADSDNPMQALGAQAATPGGGNLGGQPDLAGATAPDITANNPLNSPPWSQDGLMDEPSTSAWTPQPLDSQTNRVGQDLPTASQPSGAPPQIGNVRVVSPAQIGKPFKVQWNAHNESELARYRINVYEAHPDQDAFLGALLTQVEQPAGIHESTLTVDRSDGEMIIVEVAGIPNDSQMNTTPPQFSPMTVILPREASPTTVGSLASKFRFGPDSENLQWADVTLVAPEQGRGVWEVGDVESHLGLAFGGARGARNVALRTDGNEAVVFAVDYQIQGKSRLVGQLGFLNTRTDANNSVQVDLAYHVKPAEGAQVGAEAERGSLDFVMNAATATSELQATSSGQEPTRKLDHLFDFAGIEKGKWTVRVEITVRGGSLDPQNAAVLYGLHMRPEK